MKVAFKVWLDNDGKAFGDGPYELLKRVDETHSLHRAAKEMEMAYSKAWRLIGAMEKKLGFLLIERKVGGLSGGGSLVTLRARNLLNNYEGFRRDVNASLEKIYRKHFNASFGNQNPLPTVGRQNPPRAAKTKGKSK